MLKKLWKIIKTSLPILLNSITDLLEKYRVWFETIMCVTLSICAIIVSIQANKISQNQFLYEKSQNRPFFVIDSYENEDTNIEYVVDNTGGELRQCYVYVNHYICGDFGPSNSPDDKEVYLIAKDVNMQAEYLYEAKYLPFGFVLPTLNGELVANVMNNEMRLMNNSIMFYQFAVITISYTDSESTKSTEYYFVYDGEVEPFTVEALSDLDYHYWGYFDVQEPDYLQNILSQIID